MTAEAGARRTARSRMRGPRRVGGRHLAWAATITGAALSLIAPAKALAAGAIVGPLCLEDVRGQSFPGQAVVVGDGVWTPWTYARDPAKPFGQIALFDRPITASPALESCAQVRTRMVSAGARVILAGRVSEIALRALIFNGGGNRVQIDPGQLEATLTRVETGERPIAGGVIDLQGSKLWIKAPTRVLSTSSGIEGELEIEAWDRRIRDAQLQFAGGLSYRSDLRPQVAAGGVRGNVTVRLDLANGMASLWRGDLEGAPVLALAGDAQLESLNLAAARLNAARVQIVARSGRSDILFSDLRGDAAAADAPGQRLSWSFAAPRLRLGEIQGDGEASPNGFRLNRPEVRRVSVDAAAGRLAAPTGDILSGAVTAEFAVLRQDRIEGTNVWTRAAAPALTSIFPEGALDRVALHFKGARTAPTLGGRIDASALAIGGYEIKNALALTIPERTVSDEVVIPIRVDLPSATGTIVVRPNGQTIALTGRLKTLFLRGDVVIPLNDPPSAHLDVAANDFRLRVGSAVSASPFIAGADPNFASADLAVSNPTALRVSKASTGTTLIRADVMSLVNPILQVGSAGTTTRASLKVDAVGGVDLVYDLARGKVVIGRAKLVANNTSFELIGPGPKILDLDGTLFSDPRVSLGHLEVQIDVLGPNRVEQASFTALQISASGVERRREGEKGLTYKAELTRPVTIATFSAARAFVEDQIKIGSGELTVLDLALKNGQIDLGPGVQFRSATIAIRAAAIRKGLGQDDERFSFDDAALDVAGAFRARTPEGAINDAVGSTLTIRLSGPEQALSGAGLLTIAPFTGHADSQLEIAFRCENSPKLEVPIEYNFGAAGAGMQVQMRDGALSGEAATGPINVTLHTKGPRACSNKAQRVVLAPAARGWTYGICSRGFKVYRCRWEWKTPEVSFSYRIRLAVEFAAINVTLTGPRIRLSESGNLNVCAGGVILSPAAVIGGYSPQIDTNLPEANRIVNAYLAAQFEPIQSLAASAIVTNATWLSSNIVNGASVGYCLWSSTS